MLGGKKEHHINGWVNTSPTTPLPGLCTSGAFSLSDSDVIKSKIFPDVQRPESGVVGLLLTHPLMWCPQNPLIITFYSEKLDRCVKFNKKYSVMIFYENEYIR